MIENLCSVPAEPQSLRRNFQFQAFGSADALQGTRFSCLKRAAGPNLGIQTFVRETREITMLSLHVFVCVSAANARTSELAVRVRHAAHKQPPADFHSLEDPKIRNIRNETGQFFLAVCQLYPRACSETRSYRFWYSLHTASKPQLFWKDAKIVLENFRNDTTLLLLWLYISGIQSFEWDQRP